MRKEPSLRIPLGILALLVGLIAYALGIAWASQWIGQLPVWAQTVIYLVLGVVWLLPLRRFLIWMETGRWR
jgi:membrane protein implicated in regulation of membrane protease activity